MSYIVIKVYSFECDWPGCKTDPAEVTGAKDLRDARKQLRSAEHWTRDHYGRDLCPAHPKEV